MLFSYLQGGLLSRLYTLYRNLVQVYKDYTRTITKRDNKVKHTQFPTDAKIEMSRQTKVPDAADLTGTDGIMHAARALPIKCVRRQRLALAKRVVNCA